MLKEKQHINIIEEYENLDYGMLNYHVLESMADWVRVVDQEGRVIYANRSMKSDLGMDIIGKKCYEIIYDGEACNSCITERSIEIGEIIQKEKVIHTRK